MKSLSLLVFSVSITFAQGQPVKAFFEALPRTAPNKPPSFDETLAAVDQIEHLSAREAQDLVPLVFNALKVDTEAVGMPALQGLFALARRPDCPDLLRPHLNELFALYGRTDRRYKATINLAIVNLGPRAPETGPFLSSFILSNVGTPPEKVDALAVLLDSDLRRAPEQTEPARLHVLNLPMDPGTRFMALQAVARPGATKAVTDRIAKDLEDTNESVQTGATQSLAMLGVETVSQYRKELTRVAQFGATPNVKRLAQDVLDNKDLRCTTSQGQPMKPCDK